MSQQHQQLSNTTVKKVVSDAGADDADKDEADINLNDFLDLLNVSCHLNSCITNINGGAGAATAAPPITNASNGKQYNQNQNKNSTEPEIDFEKLVENDLVNNLLGCKKKKPATTRPNNDCTSTVLDNNNTCAAASDSTNEAAATSNEASVGGGASTAGGGGTAGITINGDQTERLNGGGSGTRRLSAFGATASAYYTRNHQNHQLLKKSDTINTGNNGSAVTNTSSSLKLVGLHPKLEKKLDYVINEGVLDSVLPFICPVPVPVKQPTRQKTKQKDAAAGKTTTAHGAGDNIGVLSAIVENGKDTSGAGGGAVGAGGSGTGAGGLVIGKGVTRRKSLMGVKNLEKKEPEVIIHVCDEVKNTSRDFVCQQSLLVSKMGYFADVTAGQKLEDMDISVHCDIQIFDWLMKWVKCNSDTAMPSSMDTGPQLDATNVVPILVSASFLQMEPLLLDCLSFCHARLTEVVRLSTNLSCLNDSIISRLAAMFTNVELEAVRDKKDRITPRLWTKLIQSLAEPETEALRGHYYSLAGLFRCSKCGKCVTHSNKSYINCVPGNMRLNRWGQLISHHVRDTSWEINVYIAQLFKELKSWRKVYWKLWGQCHCLYCCICEAHFPVYQIDWCRYHPEGPNYLGPVSEGRLPGPTGRYPCCGQQAFRFEALPGPNGCQFREHSVLVESDRERAILSTVQLVIEGGALGESPPLKLQESLASGEMTVRWVGMPLTPQRCRQGLLPPLNPDDSSNRFGRRRFGTSAYFAESSETDTSDTQDGKTSQHQQQHLSRRYVGGGGGSIANFYSSSSSDGCESDCNMPKAIYQKNKDRNKKRQTNIPGRYWCGELSARSNQDHQREFEEKVMKQVIAIVNKKTGSDHCLGTNIPVGGTYLRLEAEWKEQLKQRNNAGNVNSSSSSNANISSNSGSNNNVSTLTARNKANK